VGHRLACGTRSKTGRLIPFRVAGDSMSPRDAPRISAIDIWSCLLYFFMASHLPVHSSGRGVSAVSIILCGPSRLHAAPVQR
jgi:hypothetical protein